MVEGNHDQECHYDVGNYLDNARYLNNEVVNLNNQIVLVGVKDEYTIKVKDLLQEANVDSNKTIIVLKHRPINTEDEIGYVDLSLSGHTHGYQYPIVSLLAPL